jgi:hypothetical protein
MDADDAFWAAKQVAHFTREELRVIVESGRYTSPETVDYLTETLVVRRNKIARAYLLHGGGLGRFQVTGGALAFEDFLEHPAFEDRYADAETEVTWHRFDNQQGQRVGSIGEATTTDGRVALPNAQAPYVVAVLRRPDVGDGTTEVFLRRSDGARHVVGIRRSADGAPSTPPTWTVIPKDLRPSSSPPKQPSSASSGGQ